MDVSRAFYDTTRYFSAHFERNTSHSRLRSMSSSPFLFRCSVSTVSLPRHVRSVFRVRAARCARARAEQPPRMMPAFVRMTGGAVALSGRHSPFHRTDQVCRAHRLSQRARRTPVVAASNSTCARSCSGTRRRSGSRNASLSQPPRWCVTARRCWNACNGRSWTAAVRRRAPGHHPSLNGRALFAL